MKMRGPARKCTVRDIAREAGVSTTTVINVLKGRSSEVSASLMHRIQSIAKRRGYVRNLTAAALSTRRSHLIALLMPGAFHSDPLLRTMDLNPFYGDFVFRLEYQARARGYAIILYAGDDEGARAFLLQRAYDAVIMVGAMSQDLPSWIARQGIQLVLVDTFLRKSGACMSVCNDEHHGAELAARHLIEKGRRKIAFAGDVHARVKTLIPTIRYEGALKMCRAAGVPLIPVVCATHREPAKAAADTILAEKCDGVLTAADIIAAGIMQRFQERGIDVPRQVSVVGYDNLPIARMCEPGLTTVDLRLDEKVRRALDFVERPEPGKVIKVKPELVVRESA